MGGGMSIGAAADGLEGATLLDLDSLSCFSSAFGKALADAPFLTGEPRDLLPIPTRAHLVHLWADPHGFAGRAAAWWTIAFFRAISFFFCAGWNHWPICLHQQRQLTEAQARAID